MEKKYKEVVLNSCYGGFSLNQEVFKELIKRGVPVKKYSKIKDDERAIFVDDDGQYRSFYFDDHRDDPDLIKVIKKLGKRAESEGTSFRIVKIDAQKKYEIFDYDGLESLITR